MTDFGNKDGSAGSSPFGLGAEATDPRSLVDRAAQLSAKTLRRVRKLGESFDEGPEALARMKRVVWSDRLKDLPLARLMVGRSILEAAVLPIRKYAQDHKIPGTRPLDLIVELYGDESQQKLMSGHRSLDTPEDRIHADASLNLAQAVLHVPLRIVYSDDFLDRIGEYERKREVPRGRQLAFAGLDKPIPLHGSPFVVHPDHRALFAERVGPIKSSVAQSFMLIENRLGQLRGLLVAVGPKGSLTVDLSERCIAQLGRFIGLSPAVDFEEPAGPNEPKPAAGTSPNRNAAPRPDDLDRITVVYGSARKPPVEPLKTFDVSPEPPDAPGDASGARNYRGYQPAGPHSRDRPLSEAQRIRLGIPVLPANIVLFHREAVSGQENEDRRDRRITAAGWNKDNIEQIPDDSVFAVVYTDETHTEVARVYADDNVEIPAVEWVREFIPARPRPEQEASVEKPIMVL